MDPLIKNGATAEIARLVATVERLPMDDQARILRIVDLLLLAPPDVRWRTQDMLRALVDREPDSKADCVTGVDEVILYLEKSLVRNNARGGTFATYPLATQH